MDKINRFHWLKYIDTIGISLFCIFFYSYLLYFLKTDINTHIEQIVRINKGWISYPPNFLYYLIVNVISGFSGINVLYPASIMVLSSATIAKYIISKKMMLEFSSLQSNRFTKIEYRWFIIFSLGLFFCFAIPDPFSVFVLKKVYLTKFVPNVWHNSTLIFVLPFAILLFWKQLILLDFEIKAEIKTVVIVHLLILINILIKPSFVFAYAPVTFLYICINFNRKISWQDFLLRLSPLLTVVLVISVQYFFIYISQYGSFFNEKSDIEITTPFKMTSHFMPYGFIPFSLLLSYLLPICTIFIYAEIFNFKPFKYALLLNIFAIVISAFIMEAGPRATHGNFLWQIVICSYLLFLTTISFVIQKLISVKVKSRKEKFILAIFLLHFVSGIAYIFKIIYTHSYY